MFSGTYNRDNTRDVTKGVSLVKSVTSNNIYVTKSYEWRARPTNHFSSGRTFALEIHAWTDFAKFFSLSKCPILTSLLPQKRARFSNVVYARYRLVSGGQRLNHQHCIGLILVPNGKLLGHWVEGDSAVPGNNFWAIFFTVLGTVLLDFDADACQSPARAYLLDICVPGNC